jgi:hypothetical protein
MRLGAIFREVWGHKRWLGVGVLFALLAALLTSYRISLSPPSLNSRSLELGAASTRVMIDTPRSKLIDLAAGTHDFTSLSTRANLLANVMASEPVRVYIARRAGIDQDRLITSAPIIANVPRAVTEPGTERRASDILDQTDQWRLNISANPQVPIVYVYAQAPSERDAIALANSSVDGLRDYLREVASREDIGDEQQVQVQQLGRAGGGVLNNGVGVRLSLLAFIVVLALWSALIVMASRMTEGWRAAAARERQPGASARDEDEPEALAPERNPQYVA